MSDPKKILNRLARELDKNSSIAAFTLVGSVWYRMLELITFKSQSLLDNL